ncbi:MAG TPA: LuxR C-terminal-related transcriptional regulator [Acetobacteraceae bacterium]|nr:LuxR C-terminal-related transcriptional regulator [Acetobacteraceae bacterium]
MVHANAAGAALTSPGRSGLTISRAVFGGTQLSARHRDDNDALRRLVVGAAAGGVGGVLRVRARSDDVRDEATLAVLVSQLPRRLMTQGAGLAIIVALETSRPECVPERMLSDLYSLTTAEAAVAGALAGGITAEDVARERGVSLDTVRTQVRGVLRKTNAANLRDFERIVALLSAA